MNIDSMKVIENYRNKLSKANQKIAMLEVYAQELETALGNVIQHTETALQNRKARQQNQENTVVIQGEE